MDVRNVTILGANGTMGRNIAAIFASFGNTTVYLISRNLENSYQAKDKAYQSVRAESVKNRMIPSDYNQLKECVKKSDLIFEACAEDWDIKESIHKMVAEAVKECGITNKIICSGTSGLSITKLAELYSEPYRSHVMGMHFFNPPYQMTLCEMTPTVYTDREIFEDVKEYTQKVLLRTSIEVKDSPAFLGNRIGFQFINETLQLAEKYKDNGGIDYIDAIFGPFTGRAMPPLVTANFVGLDIHKAIVNNLYENTNDFAHYAFVLPSFVQDLINEKKLGRKAGAGLYKTFLHDSGIKIHQVYDIDGRYYRETMKYIFPFAEQMVMYLKSGDYDNAFQVLERNHSLEAEICLSGLLKYVLYSLSATEEVGYNIHAADDSMAAGFNWCPPLAMIEALGGKDCFNGLCKERISESWLSSNDQQRLISRIERSKYDYRRFIKAKH